MNKVLEDELQKLAQMMGPNHLLNTPTDTGEVEQLTTTQKSKARNTEELEPETGKRGGEKVLQEVQEGYGENELKGKAKEQGSREDRELPVSGPSSREQASDEEYREKYGKIKNYFDKEGIEIIDGGFEGSLEHLPQLLKYIIEIKNYKDLNSVLKESFSSELAFFLRIHPKDINIEQGVGFVHIYLKKDKPKFITAEDLVEEFKKSPESQNHKSLKIPFAKGTEDGEIISIDFATPHLLVGGTTGSGKTIAIESILYSAMEIYRPNELRIAMCDLKGMNDYKRLCDNSSKFFIHKKVHLNREHTLGILENTFEEIQKRGGEVRDRDAVDIFEYNSKCDEIMPYYLCVIDEVHEILDSHYKESVTATRLLKRITQQSRAAGIIMVICTQQPSARVITTDITTNYNHKLALQCATHDMSKIIIGESGAEKLVGKGDAYYKCGGRKERVQCSIVKKLHQDLFDEDGSNE